MDLRWLGNGSPHMYCFWKIREDVNVLQHHDILKARHAKDNPALKLTLKNAPVVKNIAKKTITIEKIMKKIAQKVSKKAVEKMPLGNFVITGVAGVVTEKLVDAVVDILEKNNPAALEMASSFISDFEDIAMNVTAVADDIPVAREIARGFFELSKTANKVNNYPINFFNDLGKNLFNQDNYKKVKDPLDFANNVGTGTAVALKSVTKTTVNTVKDIGYGLHDAANKFFPFLF
ncbi:MAG: hypothetical protein ACLTFB_01960 [Candidatus Phytoplasma pyri]